jgi:hypothetical protein
MNRAEETFREVVGGLINLSGLLAPKELPEPPMQQVQPMGTGQYDDPAMMDPAVAEMMMMQQPVNLAGGSTNSTPEEVGQGLPPVQY